MLRLVFYPVLGALVLLALLIGGHAFNGNCGTAKDDPSVANIVQINSLVEKWYFENGEWPKNGLSDLLGHPDYLPNGLPENPFADQGGVYVLGNDHRVDRRKADPSAADRPALESEPRRRVDAAAANLTLID